MKLLMLAIGVISAVPWTRAAMSEAQMKAALKLVRNTCQPKSKATSEQIEAMKQGDWNQDRNGQCYLNCILTMYKLQKKDNTFDWESGLKVLENQAPPSIATTAIASVLNCKESEILSTVAGAGKD
ncbi:general odorant-binding protein 19a isoform X2 [Cylas formicarius]|uniref:general odorant-binding protein 19a isoform X2 n=1 Tax=Cylas formicarius TaxID=197179 RepID=UPI002958A398|nr:general odorant-binding protein 19a isoform X2 [Cylas formicarius]